MFSRLLHQLYPHGRGDGMMMKEEEKMMMEKLILLTPFFRSPSSKGVTPCVCTHDVTQTIVTHNKRFRRGMTLPQASDSDEECTLNPMHTRNTRAQERTCLRKPLCAQR